jgi:DNA-binding phage protein
MVEEHKSKLEAYMTEELARYTEEHKNLLQPFNEDIARFRGMFKVAIEELDNRKDKGIIS